MLQHQRDTPRRHQVPPATTASHLEELRHPRLRQLRCSQTHLAEPLAQARQQVEMHSRSPLVIPEADERSPETLRVASQRPTHRSTPILHDRPLPSADTVSERKGSIGRDYAEPNPPGTD